MVFIIKFSQEKNQLLKAIRGIGFDEIVIHLKNGDLLANKENLSSSRHNQRIFVVKIDKYAYVVPYVINLQKQEIFLKTVYPSRKFTKLYLTKGN